MIKILSKKTNSITVAAILVATSSLISRLLGVFRDRVLAGHFGAGEQLDVYYSAFRVPDFIFNLIVLGAISAGFLPVFVKLKDKNKEEAWHLASLLINMITLFLVVLAIVGFIFAEPLTRIISPGFTSDQQLQVASLTRIMFISPILLGISSIVSGVLQSYRRFFVYSLSPIFYNVGIIFGAIFLTENYGLTGLAWGVVLGAFLHMAIQIPVLYKLGFKYTLAFDFKNNKLKTILKMMLPRTMSLGINQIFLLIITIIASTMSSGSLSVFNFANNLQYFPVGIFGISFAVASFPLLATVADNNEKLVYHFGIVFRKILFFVVPTSLLFFIFRYEISSIILGSGKFTESDVIATASTLAIFCISMFAQSLLPLINRVFYSKENTKTPLLTSLISVGFGIAFLVYLTNSEFFSIPVMGIALAFSFTNILNFILNMIYLKIYLKDINFMNLIFSFFRIFLISTISGVLIYAVKTNIYSVIPSTTLLLIKTAILMITAMIFYFLLNIVLKTEESYFLKIVKANNTDN